MTTLRTTVIMKTDISGSTVRFRSLAEDDLHALLAEHRALLGRHAADHGGRIVKPEGDGFWLVFASATDAARAAVAMQEELRFAQANKGDDRLAMRIVIAVGDVLHEEGALVGDTVVLTARIEAITPPDEIHLSAAAWLAMNHAEIRTALVDNVSLKGFPDPVPVYRVEQSHRTRVFADECVVITDLRGFRPMIDAGRIATIEKVLEALFVLTNRVARELGGTVRFSLVDSYCLTFADAALAMTAAERLSESWEAFVRQEALSCPVNVVLHQGVLYAFRSYLYGPGLDVAARVERATSGVLAPDEGGIFVTGEVRSRLADSVWERRLEATGITAPRLQGVEIYRLGPGDEPRVPDAPATGLH